MDREPRDLTRVYTPATRSLSVAIPEHEVSIVFNDDEAALAFREWLEAEGWEAFAVWPGEAA